MFDTKLKIRFKVNHRNGGMVHAFRTGSVPCAPPAACGIGGHAGAGPVRVIHAYRFALRPSPAQERGPAFARGRVQVRVELGAADSSSQRKGLGESGGFSMS